MALNSIEMNVLANLVHEVAHLKSVNGHANEKYGISDNETSIVFKYLESRIKELNIKKEQK